MVKINQNTMVPVSIVSSVVGCAVGLAWFLSIQLSDIRMEIRDQIHGLDTKVESVVSRINLIEYRLNAMESQSGRGRNIRPISNHAATEKEEAMP